MKRRGKSKPSTSDAAVKNATGKNWKQWFSLIDKAGGKRKTHKEIVRLLVRRKPVSDWWSQMITVEYEHSRGKRKVGEAAGAGFQIGVTKTLPISKKQGWDLITSPAGRKLWLGTVARFNLKKGSEYKTKEGTRGKIRTVKKGERIRLTWQPKKLKSPSTLQLTVMAGTSAGDASIRFHQEKLSSGKEREQMRKHWQRVLGRLTKLVDK